MWTPDQQPGSPDQRPGSSGFNTIYRPERAVRVSALQQERWWGCCASVCIGTWTLLTHPTPPVTDHKRAVPVSAQQQESWWGCCACVCIGTWTLSSHPTPPPHPPHPTGTWMRDEVLIVFFAFRGSVISWKFTGNQRFFVASDVENVWGSFSA